MAARGSADRSTLSIEQVTELCAEFLSVGDHVFDYMNELRKAGFNAFEPFEEFVLSYATSAEEVALHNRLIVEGPKTLLVDLPPHLVRIWGTGPFHSEFIENLEARRDKENGVPQHELESRYPGEYVWRSEIDPCLRHMEYFRLTNSEAFDAQWDAVVEAMRLRVAEEAKCFATGLSGAYSFTSSGRHYLFLAVMEREAKNLGFFYDKKRSSTICPVFSNRVTAEWDLCLFIEDFLTFVLTPFDGIFDLYLEIRPRELPGGSRKGRAEEYPRMRLDRVVPGFTNAYRKFRNLQELETIIKAHLFLYGLMAPIIEGGMKKILGGQSLARLNGGENRDRR
jgi:hypothetical protein